VQTGHDLPQSTVYGVFTAKDGYLVIAAQVDDAWQRLAKLIGGDALAADKRFLDPPNRNANREAALKYVRDWVARNRRLRRASPPSTSVQVPCAKVQGIDEGAGRPADHRARDDGRAESSGAGKVQLPNLPFRFSECDTSPRSVAPLMGQHNRDIARASATRRLTSTTWSATACCTPKRPFPSSQPEREHFDMTDRYAVIGNPIAHSKSPLIHSAFAEATQQDLEYTRIEGPLDGFREAVDAFRAAGGRGMNVTTPFKLQAYALGTDRMERAQITGAANCMKFDGARIYVDNFDGLGLTNDIQVNLGYPMAGRRVLMLGAGGAARGALLTFLEQNPGEVVIANRTVDKAQELATLFASRGNVRGSGYATLGADRFDIVVNATSASLDRRTCRRCPQRSSAPIVWPMNWSTERV
jgi:shikimate dehydrogenase